jgi:hypothetical protein
LVSSWTRHPAKANRAGEIARQARAGYEEYQTVLAGNANTACHQAFRPIKEAYRE